MLAATIYFRVRLMTTNEEYRTLLTKEFPRFSIDLGLCSPRSLNLSEAQFIKLIVALSDALDPYPYLTDLPLLQLSMQAVTVEAGVFTNEHLLGCIDVFTPFSANKMVSFEALILPEEIVLKQIYLRPLIGIRKASLFGEPQIDQKDPDNNDLVFLVDDNAVVLKSLSKMIMDLNPALTVRTFNDGSEIVQAYTNIKSSFFVPPKLILMDLQMPVTDGITATKAIRLTEKHNELEPSCIVALSAQEIDRSYAMNEIGFNNIVAKPFTRDMISDQLTLANVMRVNPEKDNPELDQQPNAESDDEWTLGIINYLDTKCNLI